MKPVDTQKASSGKSTNIRQITVCAASYGLVVERLEHELADHTGTRLLA